MKKLTLLCIIIFVAFSTQIEAQTCNQGSNLATRTWQQWGPWRPKIKFNPWKIHTQHIKDAWNIIVPNGSATLGPRYLELDGGNKQGTILGQTKRTFITPPSFEGRIEITINKYDGRARTGVVVCVQGQDGVTEQRTTYEFRNSRNGEVKRIVLNNVKGKIIIIAMKNLSTGYKFKYRINAKKL